MTYHECRTRFDNNPSVCSCNSKILHGKTIQKDVVINALFSSVSEVICGMKPVSSCAVDEQSVAWQITASEIKKIKFIHLDIFKNSKCFELQKTKSDT